VFLNDITTHRRYRRWLRRRFTDASRRWAVRNL